MALLELIRGNLMECQKKITKSDNNFAPTFVNHHFLPDINFNGHCLIKTVIKKGNKYIYFLGPQLKNLNTDFTLVNSLFGYVKLNKNADLDKYKYSGYRIGFYSPSEFLFADGSFGKNVIIFGAYMSLSVHIDDKGKNILILGERPTQGLDDTTLTAEAIYPINFMQTNKRFVLSLHYNGSNNFLFVNEGSRFTYELYLIYMS